MREDLAKAMHEARSNLKAQYLEGLAALEARWWSEKPQRDQKQLKELEAKEKAARTELYADLDECYLDLRDEEANLEELARLDELRRIAEEESRRISEEKAREEFERREALRRKEELKKLALHCWNMKKQEMEAVEKKKKQEEVNKLKFVTQATHIAQRAVDLQKGRNIPPSP